MPPSIRSLPRRAWPAERPLRAWQRDALAAVEAHPGTAFLASATPAAGKTTFGLRVAHAFLTAGRARRVVVLGPTAHICRQWAADAARYGLDLEPNRPNGEGPEPADRHGLCVTYQAVAAAPRGHARAAAARPTLLIADEPHHMGEQAAWGARAREAFGGAVFRLLLSGTPFRSDDSPIPWVRYDAEGVSRADFAYGYTQALREGVCRPITFHPYDGDMEWSSDGRLRRCDFSVALPAPESARRLRTALAADGDWMAEVLRDAEARLGAVRAAGQPEAGGLVVASDKEHAGRIAARLARVAGEEPAIVTSDDPGASAAIARFAAGSERWLVSVLMVSEGVDIPRLRVGVYATAARTELFFRQVVGRFIRRTRSPAEQMSHLLMPADPTLKRLATQVEEERNHALRAIEAGDEREPAERGEAREGYQPLSSSARADDVITVAPGENFALFGAPAPAPAIHLAAFGGPVSAADPRPAGREPSFRRRERLRAERSTLVAALARRSGASHREINASVNREVGVRSVGAATLEQLERANAVLARRVGRR